MPSASFAEARLTGVTGGRTRLHLVIAVATWSVLVAMASSEQAAPTLASPALAVKAGRERGASVLEKRRLEEEAAAAADEAAAAKRQKKSRSVARVPAVAVVDQALPNGVGIQGRGRATMNAPLADGSNCVAAMQQRRQSLLAAAEFRPTRKVVAVAPAGAGKFDGMPDRDEYAAGAEGEAAFARDFEQFVESNFDGKGVELRTIDQHELKAGFFGAWYERGGHGKCVEWQLVEHGWSLALVIVDGVPVVPTAAAVMSFVCHMAKGDKRCPKGGWVDYRNGPWYKLALGKKQGDLMASKGQKAFGFGPHANEPCRFTTIEQKISGMRMWYDKQLKDSCMANPFRNQRVLDLMASLEMQMGRAVAHKTAYIEPAHLRAVQGEVDLENQNEVCMVSYMSKNVVKGSRAQTEGWLDWAHVRFVEKSAERAGGNVYHQQCDKDNKKQVDREKPLHCTSTCQGKVERGEDGKLKLETFCPAHFDQHLKSLQARDVGVPVKSLRGPVHGEYRLPKDVPAGATARMLDKDSAADQCRPLVCVVTREQADQGMCYDRSQPFVINGKLKWPPPRGMWCEVRVDGQNYFVHAWANAAGVTHRMRKQGRATNARSGKEVVPKAVLKSWTSKVHRVTMATLLTRKGVPLPEVQRQGDWDSPEMCEAYIRLIDALAPEQRNLTDIMYREYATASLRSSGATATTTAVVEQEQMAPEADCEVSNVPEEAAMEDLEFAGLFDALVDIPGLTAAEKEMVMPSQSKGPVSELLPADVIELVEPQSVAKLPPVNVTERPVAEVLPAEVSGLVEPAPMQASKKQCKRAAEGDVQYEGCCDQPFKKRARNPLAGKQFLTNTLLQGLLKVHEAQKPEQMQQILCAHNFHVTRKEITNYNDRKKSKERQTAGA